jgi:hypothetical protein
MAERTLTDRSLSALQPDDAIRYAGIVWQVDEQSTYSDRQGYCTTEWLLTSATRHQYFLLREVAVDSESGSGSGSETVTWYLAEELSKVAIVNGESEQLLPAKAFHQAMVDDQQPYPVLKVANRTYFFESATRGTYRAEEDETEPDRQERITWDYWDEPHIWNLALEVWPTSTELWLNDDLKLYNTREVEPEEFSLVDKPPRRRTVSQNGTSSSSRTIQLTMAWFVMGLGLAMMIAGD